MTDKIYKFLARLLREIIEKTEITNIENEGEAAL